MPFLTFACNPMFYGLVVYACIVGRRLCGSDPAAAIAKLTESIELNPSSTRPCVF